MPARDLCLEAAGAASGGTFGLLLLRGTCWAEDHNILLNWSRSGPDNGTFSILVLTLLRYKITRIKSHNAWLNSSAKNSVTGHRGPPRTRRRPPPVQKMSDDERGNSPTEQNDFEHGLCSCFANCDICTVCTSLPWSRE
jgi:hypothetical protein